MSVSAIPSLFKQGLLREFESLELIPLEILIYNF